MNDHSQKLERSKDLFQRARKYIPSGTSNLNICPGKPRYIVRGDGSRVYDVDGNEYTDFSCHWTTLVHGHNREVISAAKEAVGRGPALSFFCEAEYDLAKLICEAVPSVDQIKFANTGSAAIELALACAFAVTGRPNIAKLDGTYHGSSLLQYFNVATTEGPEHAPLAAEQSKHTPEHIRNSVVIVPGHSLTETEALLRKHGKDLACVLVDLNPRHLCALPLPKDYVDMLRRVTKELGVLLIVDEVVSFRLSPEGAQKRYGLTPDLTVFGKIIGGGFPIGAVGGRKEFMAVFEHEVGAPPEVPIFGTFTANPVSMSAGLAAMRLLKPASYDHLNRLGDLVRSELTKVLWDVGVVGSITGVGSIFSVNIMRKAPTPGDCRTLHSVTDAERTVKNKLHEYMFDHGFMFDQPFYGCTSTALVESDVERMAATFKSGLLALRDDKEFQAIVK